MHEHLSRATFLLEVSRAATSAIARHRLQLAAIYSCRAIVELMFEAAKEQEVRSPCDPSVYWDWRDLEDHIAAKLPFFSLVEKIRIHDFHRFGVLPPDPGTQQVFLGGPIKLVAQAGTVAVALSESGPVHTTGGKSMIKPQRPLLDHDGKFFDDPTSRYVTLDEVIESFTASAHEVLADVAASAA